MKHIVSCKRMKISLSAYTGTKAGEWAQCMSRRGKDGVPERIFKNKRTSLYIRVRDLAYVFNVATVGVTPLVDNPDYAREMVHQVVGGLNL